MPVAPDDDAADVVFVGELRRLKGVDVLIEALARLHRRRADRKRDPVRRRTRRGALPRGCRNGAASRRTIQFGGVKPAREAFRRGRVLVVPSRAESLPYIVLEAAAASVPMVATRVGGMPEIFGPDAAALVPPEDPAALAEAILRALQGDLRAARTKRLQARVAHANLPSRP